MEVRDNGLVNGRLRTDALKNAYNREWFTMVDAFSPFVLFLLVSCWFRVALGFAGSAMST
jgi:hypothetical protein